MQRTEDDLMTEEVA